MLAINNGKQSVSTGGNDDVGVLLGVGGGSVGVVVGVGVGVKGGCTDSIQISAIVPD
jgi:hypothetical protein